MCDDAASSQESLFSGETGIMTIPPPSLPNIDEWSIEDCLRREKEIIGFYLSGDPLEKYIEDIKEFSNITLSDIPNKKPKEIRIGGIIHAVNIRYDKKNRPWAIIELNASEGRADVFVFNDLYEKIKDLLSNDSCIFIKGKPSDRDERGDTLKMVADDVFPLAQAREKLSHHINVMIDSGQTDEGLLETLKDLSEKNKGRLGLILHLKAKNGTVQRIRARTTGLNASKDFVKNLRDVFRDSHVWIS